MCDFNAQVGMFNPQDELWYRIEEIMNLAGEDFLQFCQCNLLSIMNTYFQKKPIHYGTWMHLATKLHHMIVDKRTF